MRGISALVSKEAYQHYSKPFCTDDTIEEVTRLCSEYRIDHQKLTQELNDYDPELLMLVSKYKMLYGEDDFTKM